MIGKWIDGLDDAERDAVIQHPDPTFDGSNWWSHRRKCGCLVGCVVVERFKDKHRFGSPYYLFLDELISEDEYLALDSVGITFPKLTRRFGAERIWRAAKLRAAKANRVVLPAVTEEAAVAV